MVIVADTSPLNYLIVIGYADVLPVLFGEIWIPPMVLEELSRSGAPKPVRSFAPARPHWIRVSEAVAIPARLAVSETIDAGERSAIALAESSGPAVLLLIDDRNGRIAAEKRGIETLGTLGILSTAADEGLLDLRPALAALLRTNFRVSRKLIDRLLAADRQMPG